MNIKKFDHKNSSNSVQIMSLSSQRQVKSVIKYAMLIGLCTFGYFRLVNVANDNSQVFEQLKDKDRDLEQMGKLIADLAAKIPAFDNSVDKYDTGFKKIDLEDGITEEAAMYIEKLNLINPGENGSPVELPKNLSAEIQAKIDESFNTHGFNAFVSSLVSLNRQLPDIRSEVCKQKVYTNLPKCSILIPVHEEEWTLLMRTIHSILNRSPMNLIEEIILIDDASERDYLHGRLDDFVAKFPFMKILRSHKRMGIANTRMLGAVNAIGPIIVYVDSHVEVFEGWLEPLLDRFTKNMNVLVWPKFSTIENDNLKVDLSNESPGPIGGFKWNLDFDWIDLIWYEGDKPTEKWEPKKSPTLIGALRAISKQFFIHLGMSDPDFDAWGGEDVELSFKVWLCGGKIEYVPCSLAAHMYKQHKYKFIPGKGGYTWNTDRIAEVYLDEYKRYYYRAKGDTKLRNYGDVSARRQIREKLNCHPFKWLIDNVYPQVPIPDNIKDPVTENNVAASFNGTI